MDKYTKAQHDLSLLDDAFLAALSEQQEREIYARIAALNFNEEPIEYIEGKVQGGSISIDGNSAVRRTCSLTMVTENIDINDFYWGIKTKISLEIGLKNNLPDKNQYSFVNLDYPDIVWFPQGKFVLSSFNTSVSTSNRTISLQGKDKMCMLNGDLGGQLFASIDFGTREEQQKVFTKISSLDATSDVLVAKHYYIIPDTLPEVVQTEDDNYSFELNDNGEYGKIEDEYRLKDDSYRGNVYKIYALVNKPSQMFEMIIFDNNNPYVKDTYYYIKNMSYQLTHDTEINDTKTYFLKENSVYTPVLNPNINLLSTYYEETEGYYVLDNSKTQTNNRVYYKLKDLYEINYEYTIKKIPLAEIIREAVHAYAGEPYHNIIINDLDNYGLEQLTYKGDVQLYALRDNDTEHFVQLIISSKNDSLRNIVEDINFVKDPLTSSIIGNDMISRVHSNDNKQFELGTAPGKKTYTVAVFNYGEDIGYRLTDLVYAGDLISSLGESLTSILDKIKGMLGNFEYFYDVEGHFIFQQKQNYVNTVWDQFVENGDEKYVTFQTDKQKFSFNFEGNKLITAVQNSPILNNLKNDFSVWGKRKSVSGADIPIHARYAIDKKPVYYKALNGKIYVTDEKYLKQDNDINASREQVKEAYYRKIKNFQMQHRSNISAFVSEEYLPQQRSDGSWTAGWWDIRDWHDFYVLLTGEEPTYTMKWYSQNSTKGCVKQNTIPYPSWINSNKDVWLLSISPSGIYSAAHGSGTYNDYQSVSQTLYESFYLNELPSGVTMANTSYSTYSAGSYFYRLTDERAHETGYQYIQIKPVTDEEGNLVKQSFHQPYSGCSPNHTYTYFLEYEVYRNNYQVLFYNPDFPNATFEELIDEGIEKELEKLIEADYVNIVDWREIIYQMALDYFAGQGCSYEHPIYYKDALDNNTVKIALNSPDHFLAKVAEQNPNYYPTGYTGYEQYYTDMQGFWRQLYNPFYSPAAIYKSGYYENENVYNTMYYKKTKVWNDKTISDYEFQYFVNSDKFTFPEEVDQDIVDKYQQYLVDTNDRRLYWNIDVWENPEVLNFWFDFLDDENELAQFSVKAVGDRSKTINEDKVTSIIFREIPDIILCPTIGETANGWMCDISKIREGMEEQTGYTYIYMPKGFAQYFTMSYRSLSAKDKIDDLLYQYAYCIENISITALPIYYLQPNTRIYVRDENTNINGEYLVSKINLSLAYNGLMSLSAVKAPERFY